MALQKPIFNKLLLALSEADLDILRPHLERRVLPLKENLEKPHAIIEAVYFLESGIVSVVSGAQDSDPSPIEIGLLGREGMSGTTTVLGGNSSPYESYMQVAG